MQLSQSTESTTNFYKLEQAFNAYNPSGLYIVVRDRLIYKELAELNQSAYCQFKWFTTEPDDQDASSESTAMTTDDVALEYGAIRLDQPMYLHEKKKKGFEDGFLFGRFNPNRSRFLDIVLSRDVHVSRVHFGLFHLCDLNGNWVVQGFGGKVCINNDFWLDKSTRHVALHPYAANSVQVNDMEFELYCNPRFVPEKNLDISLIQGLFLSKSDHSMTTTVRTIEITESSHETGNTDSVYFFEHETWKNGQGDKYVLAMDPWTCQMFIAKPFAKNHRPILEERLRAFRKLPVSVSTSFRCLHSNYNIFSQMGRSFAMSAW
jgi:hypothetical protein